MSTNNGSFTYSGPAANMSGTHICIYFPRLISHGRIDALVYTNRPRHYAKSMRAMVTQLKVEPRKVR